MADEKPPPEFVHPFHYEDADLVLQSKDGVKFRVHSVIMKLGSTVFRDMLSIKRDESESVQEPIALEERAEVLKIVLELMYPDHNFNVSDSSLDTLADVSAAGTKYDIEVVTGVMKACLYTWSSLERFTATEKYGLAVKMGWDAIAEKASYDTLDLDLNSETARKQLGKLQGETIMNLLALHRKRKVILMNSLHSICREPPYDDDEPSHPMPLDGFASAVPHFAPHNEDCSARRVLSEHQAWLKLKLLVAHEMEKCSSGKRFLSDDFFERNDVVALWSTKFPCSCWTDTTAMPTTITLDKAAFVARFRDALNTLPKTVGR